MGKFPCDHFLPSARYLSEKQILQFLLIKALTGEFLVQRIFGGSNGKQRIASYIGDVPLVVAFRSFRNEFEIGLSLIPIHNPEL